MGGVAVAAAQTFPFRVFSFPSQIEPIDAVMGQYIDYINFSDFALAKWLDPVLEDLSSKLGYAHAARVDRLVATNGMGC